MEYLKFFMVLGCIVLLIKYFRAIVYYGYKTIKWIVLLFAALLGYESGGFIGAFFSILAVYVITTLIIAWFGVKTIKFFTGSSNNDDYDEQLPKRNYYNEPELDDRPINIHYHDNRHMDVHYHGNNHKRNQRPSYRNDSVNTPQYKKHESEPPYIEAEYDEIEDTDNY